MNNLPRGVSTMANIKILTDSSVQLTPEEIEKYNITIVPLSVEVDGKILMFAIVETPLGKLFILLLYQ